MRKFVFVFLILTLVSALTLPASADILWEPDDSYYYSHDCTGIARIYYVPEGMTVNLYSAPEGGVKVNTWTEGTRVYVGFSTEAGGETWGVGYALGQGQEGWFRLGRLQREYSHAEFAEAFGSSFVETDDILTRDDVTDAIYTWTYPGSGLGDRTIPAGALGGGYNDGVLDFHYVYTDPDGGRWGYVGYYMGRCGWVWLDDPENPETPLFPQTPENTVTDTALEEKAPGLPLLWIVIAVAAAVAVTSVLIAVLKKKRR